MTLNFTLWTGNRSRDASRCVPNLVTVYVQSLTNYRAERHVFKSKLKTLFFNQAITEHGSDLPPAPLNLRPYGAIINSFIMPPPLIGGALSDAVF